MKNLMVEQQLSKQFINGTIAVSFSLACFMTFNNGKSERVTILKIALIT